jgi:hypothetical protein
MGITGSGPRLLEREIELAYLRGCLEDACQGHGGFTLVTGPAGIGKSALLAAAGRAAGELGLGWLKARGGELEAGMAFGAARQLLEPVMFSMGAPERSRVLAGPARLGASALGLEGGEAPEDDFAARHGLYWLCANLAGRRPLLITVDDLQWVDGPSLSWLLYLGRRAVDLSVFLVATLREGDPHAGQTAVAALADDSAIGRLRLVPLGADGVAAVVSEVLGRAASQEFLPGLLGADGRKSVVRTATGGRGTRRGNDRGPG